MSADEVLPEVPVVVCTQVRCPKCDVATQPAPPAGVVECIVCLTRYRVVDAPVTSDQITTAAALDALPDESVILDAERWLWRKWAGEWQCGGAYGRPVPYDILVHGLPGIFGEAGGTRGYGPFVVLYRPDRPAPQVDREVLADLFVTHLGEWQARWWGLIDAILAARGDAAPAAPLRTEWGVQAAGMCDGADNDVERMVSEEQAREYLANCLDPDATEYGAPHPGARLVRREVTDWQEVRDV